MHRSSLYLAAALGFALAGSGQAQDLVGGITDQLRGLGFQQIDVRQTLLGRTRIVARSAEGQREIILNPNTGEILRDFWQAAPGQSTTRQLVDNRNSGNGSSGDDNSTSGSDDGDDDDSGPDNSNDGQSESDDRGGNSGSDDGDDRSGDRSDDESNDRDDDSDDDGADDNSDDGEDGDDD